MNAHDAHVPNPHERCVELLPAYLLRRLSDTENAAIDAHLENCSDCRAELRLADRLQNYFKRQSQADAVLQDWLETRFDSGGESPQHDELREQRNFERLWTRIEDTAPAPQRKLHPGWLSAAAAALVLTVVGAAWREHLLAPSYRTLANDGARVECGALHVRFVDNFAASDLQNLLRSVDAQIVAGPTPHGVYTLRAPHIDAALQRLHLHPAVMLAEPTGC